MNLLKRTQELIEKSGLSQEEIAKGADVGYDWFKKFAQGRIPGPSVKRVQSLYDFLTKREAEKGRGKGRHAA